MCSLLVAVFLLLHLRTSAILMEAGNVMNNVHVDKKLANVDKKLAQGKCIRGMVGVAAED